MKNIFNARLIIGVLCASMLFLLIPPFALGVISKSSVVSMLFLLIVLANFDSKIGANHKKLNFALVMSFLYMYMAIKSYGAINFTGAAMIISVSLIYWAKDRFIEDLLEYFTWVYALMMTMSSIFYILFLLGFNLPVTHVDMDGTSVTQLSIYPFFSMGEFRFAGMFDEPGVVGTISAVLLLAHNFEMKWYLKLPLFISGALSLSLFFYAIMFLYALLSKSYKLILLMVIAFYAIYQVTDGDVMLFIESRIRVDDGEFVTNRTTRSFDSWYEKFRETESFWLGLGEQKSLYYNEGGASYKNLIVDYGLIFFFVLTTVMMVMSKLKVKGIKHWIPYVFVFVGIISQRPFLGNIIYDFLLFTPMVMLASKSETIRSANPNKNRR